ncbi:MAG: hypothetical protein FWD45_02040 [Coriobacteriia bacterium]|nr:hypothetical protein [Coriobacteriia bacterium]
MVNFKESITEQVESKNLTSEQACQFSWLCAVRALPFLAVARDFGYWSQATRQQHLLSVFYALDLAALYSDANSPVLTRNRYDNAFFATNAAVSALRIAAKAANAADAIGESEVVVDPAAWAAYASTHAASVAANAANINAAAKAFKEGIRDAEPAGASLARAIDTCADPATDTDAYIGTDLNTATLAAQAANASNNAADSALIDFSQIILADLERMSNESALAPSDTANTAIYSDIWSRFVRALRAIDCGYWADWYTELFKNGLTLSASDFDEIETRRSATGRAIDEGAASVARYVENQKQQDVVWLGDD